MNKKLHYTILEAQSLIVEYYHGKFNTEELINFKKKIANDTKFNFNYSVISDIRELEFLFQIEEVEKYVEFLITNPLYIGKRKTAMITKTPNQVVTSLGFDIFKGEMPIKFEVFSTLIKAYSFLGLNHDDRLYVDSALAKLKSLA